MKGFGFSKWFLSALNSPIQNVASSVAERLDAYLAMIFLAEDVERHPVDRIGAYRSCFDLPIVPAESGTARLSIVTGKDHVDPDVHPAEPVVKVSLHLLPPSYHKILPREASSGNDSTGSSTPGQRTTTRPHVSPSLMYSRA
jgi:hypothetical protein